MEAILKKDSLRAWMAELEAHAEVHAPAFADGVWDFAPAGDDSSLDHGNTVRPSKGFAFPQREVLFRFETGKGKAPVVIPTVPDPRPTVVFASVPATAAALCATTRCCRAGSTTPTTGAADQVTLVGLACNVPPSVNCFCRRWGAPPFRGRARRPDDRARRRPLSRQGDHRQRRRGGRARPQAVDDAKPADRKQVAGLHAAADAHPQRGVFGDMDRVAAGLKKNFELAGMFEAGACLPGLRHLHLSVPHLPLLRHQ